MLYATDEDIAIRASADYPLLCPRDQVIALGGDALFSSTDPWLLTSPTISFEEAGAVSGNLLQLTSDIDSNSLSLMYAIGSVAGNSLRLRQKGQPTDIGQPPQNPTDGSTFAFQIATLTPQICQASSDLNQRLGLIDNALTGLTPLAVNSRQLKDAAVLLVLQRQYLQLCNCSAKFPDAFLAKAEFYKREFEDLLSRIVIYDNRVPGNLLGIPGSSRLTVRLSR